MPTIRILPHPEYCPQGDTLEAPRGASVCEALLENGIAIEHACEMSCACTTCHVVVKQGYRSLGEPDEIEEQKHLKRWSRGKFDPERFDMAKTDKAVRGALRNQR